MTRRLTIVFPGATSPPRDGASSFVQSVLSLLDHEGHELELIVPSFMEPVEPAERSYAVGVARWLVVPQLRGSRVSRAVTAVSRARPAWTEAYATDAVLEAVRNSARDSDLIVGFGAASSAILTRVRRPGLLVIFSLPYDDASRAGSSRLGRHVSRRFQAALVRRHDLVAAVTPLEQERLGAPATWLPFPRGSSNTPASKAGDRLRLLFIADWNYQPNRAGLSFLTASVLPKVWQRYPETELVLAGKGSAELDLRGAGGRVRLWGEYGTLDEVSDDSTIAVLPLLAASGVRTRLLELLGAGIPVVATDAATGGVDMGAGVLVASPETLADRLLDLIDSPGRVQDMRRLAREDAGSWLSDEEIAARWAAAFHLTLGGR